MNLSSTIAENKQSGTGFLNSAMVVGLVFLALLIVWGGMLWYIKTLDTTLAGKKAQYEQSVAQLRGENVERVTAFDTRLELTKKQVAANSTETEKLLGQIESLVVPSVRLTKYEYSPTGKYVAVQGETDNFKSVAQQLVSLKSESPFTGIHVDSLKKDDKGVITFTFKAEF
jgi:hypothetical protein